jgi:hypothetical protein
MYILGIESKYENEWFHFISIFSALQKECYYLNNIQMVKLVGWKTKKFNLGEFKSENC